MNSTPILFNSDMVRAILSGTKTQTRRAIKPKKHGVIVGSGCVNGIAIERINEYEFSTVLCPFGTVSDQLWVRETCSAHERVSDHLDGVLYNADNEWIPIENTQAAADQWVSLNYYRGKRGALVPSIHMPKWASRITLQITNVRIERLNDISESEAQDEGAQRGCYHLYSGTEPESYRQAFASLWERVNGAGSWNINPWVWVIEFEVLK